MAHANPEFALGLMRREAGPVSHQLPAPASLQALRSRIREIGERLADGRTVTADEERSFHLWQRVQRQGREQAARERQVRDALAEPVGGMHAAGRRGERFTEPKRRYPTDVQAGREKARRGTLPR
ncbi:hypothetical protein [Methylorubrum populi]|uniref:hypothetical protein n=1 Tax=Methylorubrum populi TaxID=223967 RepID=UPI000DB6026F|nr:hypothetical protein [Methylorubrum populi]PZP71789.1 MAG: hypothetical protein DI590_05880 [Methylorubrum populi]